MKYTMLFVAGAVAQSALLSDISTITSDTTGLQNSVSKFAAVSDAPALLSAVAAVISAVNKGDSDAKAATPLSVIDASNLIQPVTSLSAAVKAAIDATVAKKSTFVSLGLGAEVEDQLTQIQSAANKFSSDLVSAVPAAVAPVATSLAGPIASYLASGVAAFSGLGSAPASGSATGSATATGSGSSSTGASAPGYGSTSTAATSTKASSSTPATSTPASYTGAANVVAPAGILAAAGLLLAL